MDHKRSKSQSDGYLKSIGDKEDIPLEHFLESILEKEETRNKVDYDKMLTNFHRQDYGDTMKQKRVKVFKEHNSNWKKNLHLMREKVEEDSMMVIKKRLDSMKKKSQTFLATLREAKEEKERSIELKKQKSLKALIVIKENNIRNANIDEDFRHQTNLEVLDRLHRLSDSKQKLMNIVKTKFVALSTKNSQQYLNQWQTRIEEEMEKKSRLESEAFNKYFNFYEHMKRKRGDKVKEKEKLKEKEHKKEELIEELKDKELRRSQSIINNLNKIQKRREEKSIERAKQMEEKSLRFRETCRHALETKRSLSIIQDNRNKASIEKQVSLISNQTIKEMRSQLLKSSIMNKSIIHNIEVEKQVQQFYKRLESIKKNSIMKLNYEQQKSIYQELKREKEEELRRKQEEDEKAKNG